MKIGGKATENHAHVWPPPPLFHTCFKNIPLENKKHLMKKL